jgi:hypothetical protein
LRWFASGGGKSRHLLNQLLSFDPDRRLWPR